MCKSGNKASKGNHSEGYEPWLSQEDSDWLVDKMLRDSKEPIPRVLKDKRVLFCVVGKSASGKDTLCRLVKERLGYDSICSFTDRPMREGEINGREHYFLSKEEMTEVLATQHILAKTQIGEYRYCATVESITDTAKFYIVDPDGIKYLQENADNLGIYPYVIYIDVPDDIRCKRAKLRGDLTEVFLERCASEDKMFEEFRCNIDKNKDYTIILNYNLEIAYIEFSAIVLSTLYLFGQTKEG